MPFTTSSSRTRLASSVRWYGAGSWASVDGRSYGARPVAGSRGDGEGDGDGKGFPLRRQRKRTRAVWVELATTVDWSVRSAPRSEVNVVAEIRGASETSVLDGEVLVVVGGV